MGGAVIRGVVQTDTGTPVEGARVVVTRAPVPLPDIAAVTDLRGRFSFQVPVGGTYTLTSFAENLRPGESRVIVPDTSASTQSPDLLDEDVGSDETPMTQKEDPVFVDTTVHMSQALP